MDDLSQGSVADIPQAMTVEEVEIALSFLKKRFSEYSPEQIIISLSQHLQNKEPTEYFDRREPQESEGISGRDRIQDRRRGRRRDDAFVGRRQMSRVDPRQVREKLGSMTANHEERINRFEEIRLVAKVFCQTGVNYNLIRYFFPHMSPQQYRCYIQTINNQTINQIQKFLRYQCNIQIEHLSYDQKRSMKGQLMKVREWLGQRSIEQLQTYYKFVERHYEQKGVQITYDQALKLYKTLLQIIKSPFVDVMEGRASQNMFQGDRPYYKTHSDSNFAVPPSITKQEERVAIQSFIKHKNLSRVSQKLTEQFGYNPKWSKHSIRAIIKGAIRNGLKKLVLSCSKYLKGKYEVCFDHSEDTAALLFETESAIKQKVNLLRFYIDKKVTIAGLSHLVRELNLFYSTQGSNASQSSCDSIQILPKLEGTPIEKMEIIDLDQQVGGVIYLDGCEQLLKEQFGLTNDNSVPKSQHIRRMEPQVKEEEDKTPELQTQDTVRGVISLL